MDDVATVVVGRYPHTGALRRGEVTPHLTALRFHDVEPVHDAFDAMVADLRYDVCEIAVAAFFQAVGAGRPLKLLPAVTLGRHQHGSIYVDPRAADRLGIRTPADLAGHRIAVRSYSQTTGMWVRGILAAEHGLDAGSVTWLTTEASHLAGFTDPPWAVPAPAGSSVLELLETGAVQAAVHAPGLPVTDWCRPLIADAETAATAYAQELGAVPVNHLLCVGPRLAADPVRIADLEDAVRRSYAASGSLDEPAGGATVDRAAITRALERALVMAEAQGLVAPGLRVEDMFATATTDVGGTR